MISNRLERTQIYAALGIMYANGLKTPARDIPVNSLVIVETKDEHDEQPYYQLFLIYRRSLLTIRCAFFNGDIMEDDFEIKPDDLVVLLQPNPVPSEPIVKKTRAEKNVEAMEEVRTRTTRAILYGNGTEYYLSELRHNKEGRPTSGIVENGGWRIRFDPKGNAFNGRNPQKMFTMDVFEMIYIPTTVWKKARCYDSVMNWGERVPKEFRIKFDLTKA